MKNFTLLILLLLSSLSSTLALNHQFKIMGKIQFKSPQDEKVMMGLYGARLQLHFLNDKGGVVIPDKLYLYQDQLITTVKPDGSFKFDFSMFINLYNCTQLAIEVMPSSSATIIEYDESQYITKTSLGYISIIKDLGNSGVVTSFDANNYLHEKNYMIEVSNRLGNNLRGATIAKEFSEYILQKMGDNTSLPAIPIKYQDPSKDWAIGDYRPSVIEENDFIRIKSTSLLDHNVIYHEYGHYFHHELVKFKIGNLIDWYNTPEAYIEGFADFFSMAARSYASAKYGDDIVDKLGSNHETNPFFLEPFSKAAYSDRNIQVPQFAGYLWSVYDGPSHPYLDKNYKGMDNDDVDGYKYKLDVKIFNIIKQLGVGATIIPNLFHSEMTKNLPSGVGSSIGKIYNFMVVNKGNLEMPMRRVPIKSASAEVTADSKLKLTMNLQAYSDCICKNQTLNDFKIYEKIQNAWVSQGEYKNIPSTVGKKAYLNLKDINLYKASTQTYKITPFNNAGESLEAVAFTYTYTPMYLNVTSPKEVYADIPSAWQVEVKEGYANYSYIWYVKYEGENTYQKIKHIPASNKSKESFQFLPDNGKNFTLKIEVKDLLGRTATEEIAVKTIVRPIKATILGPQKLLSNEKGNWIVTIEGGLPPYQLIWATKTGDDFSNFHVGNSYSAVSYEDFYVKLGITDAKKTVKNVELFVEISPSPIQIEIKGDVMAYLHKESNWSVSVKGGKGPYKIIWTRNTPSNKFFNWMTNLDYDILTYSEQFKEEGDHYLRVWVEDANKTMASSKDFKVIALYKPAYIIIEGPEVLSQGELGQFYPHIDGGSGSFEYTWNLYKKNGDFVKKVSTDKLMGFTPSISMGGDYKMEIVVKDLYKNQLAYGTHAFKVKPLDIGENPGDDIFKIVISPNPASNLAMVNYDLPEDALVELAVYDLYGNIILRKPPLKQFKGTNRIDVIVNNLKADTYLLKLNITNQNNKKYTQTTRLIIY